MYCAVYCIVMYSCIAIHWATAYHSLLLLFHFSNVFPYVIYVTSKTREIRRCTYVHPRTSMAYRTFYHLIIQARPTSISRGPSHAHSATSSPTMLSTRRKAVPRVSPRTGVPVTHAVCLSVCRTRRVWVLRSWESSVCRSREMCTALVHGDTGIDRCNYM